MTRVVISQSMYFPWVGILEQIRQADVFIHYDDVQYAKGFLNRVQVKQVDGQTVWMSIPLDGFKRGQKIDEIRVRPHREWVSKHLAMLHHSFAPAPHKSDAIELAEQVLETKNTRLADITRSSIRALATYFQLDHSTHFLNSAEMNVGGSSSRRLLELVKAAGGDTYVTGHGARNYLDHEMFEREGVAVEYMDYRKASYPQPHGTFTPYVTGLDLIACCGQQGIDYLGSKSRHWRSFLDDT